MIILSDVISCCVLVYIFMKLAVAKPESVRTVYINCGIIALIMAIYTIIHMLFPDVPRAVMSLFIFTLPTCLFCWKLTDYKGWHFIAVFCSVDIVGFAINVMASGISVLLNLHPLVEFVLKTGSLLLLAFYFHKRGDELKAAVSRLENGWKELAFLTMSFYAFLYFFLLYPGPIQNRLEYAPVAIGFCGVLLMAYRIVIATVRTMGQVYDMEQEEMEMRLQLEVQKKQLEEEKTKFLVSQIRPHYIYNTLMSIRYLTKKDPDTAYEMIGDFSKYLRANVTFAGQDHYISFREELEHINAYVRIEQVRCKDKLKVVYGIEEEDFLIPPLTVEPLVENAIKHGFDPELGEEVSIRSYREGDAYIVEVEDNGTGIDLQELEEKHALGLRYIKKRLEMLDGAEVIIISGKEEKPNGRGVKARLRIPEIKEEHEQP